MSKTIELARHLETLHINDMYKTDFYWTWDKTDDEIDAVFTVADALRDRPRDRQHGLLHGRRHRHPGRYVHRRGPQVSDHLHGRREGRLPRRHSGAAAHPGEPAVRRGSPHPVHGRYAARHPLLRRRGEPEGQEGRHDLGLFSLLRQASVRSPGRYRPVHPLRHGRDPGPSRGL